MRLRKPAGVERGRGSRGRFRWGLAVAALAACAWLVGGAARASAEAFPRPTELEPDVRFWIRVFTEVGTDGGYLHDARDLSIVYETIQFPEGWSPRSRERYVEQRREHYRHVLRRLATERRGDLSDEERRVLALFPDDVSDSTLRDAADRLRFQLGQANKMRSGLVRSGAWEKHVRETFANLGLPEELEALPHVESSYNPNAYSRVGAAGMWQFTRSTGRRYLRVDSVVDERMDPFRSTVAAARLLEHNRQVTGSWPLAITAYNHGAAGVRQAVQRLGTLDIATIVRRYQSRTFGFASRNFYVEFLAALDVTRHVDRYFGDLKRDPELDYEVVAAPAYLPAAAIVEALGVDAKTLRHHNPALRPAVWQGSKLVPRGYELRLPVSPSGPLLAQALDAIPAPQRLAAQRVDRVVRVRRGDTLSGIAARYGVSIAALAETNNLRSRHTIRVGQRLELPGRGRAPAAAAVASAAEPIPADGLYRVRRGDTLEAIARRAGVSEAQLVAWNSLASRHRIYAGQVLKVTAPETGAPAPEVVVASAAPVEVASAAPTPLPPAPQAEPDDDADSSAAEAEVDDGQAEASQADDEQGEVAEPAESEVADAEPDDARVGDAASDAAEVAAEAEVVQAVEVAEQAAEEAEPSLAIAADDPNDYSVADDGTIEVLATETLGHYAEWLGLRASDLRHRNHLRFGDPVIVGRRLELDFSQVDRKTFERQRIAYHRDIQEQFFSQFQIAGTEEHVMRRGESIWTLSQREYRVPLWLLRQYNPDLDFAAVAAGTRITVPRLEQRSS